MSLENSDDVMIQTKQDTLLFEEGDSIKVTWNPFDMSRSVGNFINTANIRVDIKLIEIDSNTDEHKELLTIASGIQNSGVADLSIQGLNQLTGTGLYQVRLFIEAKFSADPMSKRAVPIVPLLLRAGVWAGHIFYAVKTDIPKLCEKWASKEPTSVGQEILEKVRREFPCPPTADQARRKEISNLELSNSFISVFHPLAKNCFRQSAGTE